MARVFRQTFTKINPKTGKRVKKFAKKWYIEYADHRGVIIKVPGLPDKSLTQQMAAGLERDAMRVRAGAMSPEEINSSKATIQESIDAYVKDLRAQGRTNEHCDLVKFRLDAVAKGCKWIRVIDMSGLAAQAWLANRMSDKKDGIGAQTQCHYISTLRAFAQWLMFWNKLARDPFIRMERANVEADRKHRRRALSAFSFMRLLLVTSRTGRKPNGFDGKDRAALYLLAAFSGFRAPELAALNTDDLSLDGDPPTVRIAADESKNRKAAVIPIPPGIACRLAEWLQTKSGTLWPGPWAESRTGGKMLKRDLEEARIPYDVKGRVFDFHSLRVQFGTMLARAGVPLQQAQRMMRHSDPRLTANFYTQLELNDLGQSAAKMTAKKPRLAKLAIVEAETKTPGRKTG